MNMVPEQPIKSVLNSANLATLREVIATTRVLREAIGNAIQVRVVLDTNVILRDLIYLSKRRGKVGVRTSIQELIVSQTLIPYAPSVAIHEVERNLPSIAGKRHVAVEVMQEVWVEYRKSLHFCDVKREVSEDERDARDPTDLPFIQLAKKIGAGGIATNDKDIPAMGGNSIHFDCIIQLRDYARAKQLELTIQFGGMVLMVAGVTALIALVRVFQNIIRSIGQLPTAVKLVLVGAVVFVIAHPKSREAVAGRLKALGSGMKNGVLDLRGPFSEAVNKFADAQKSANAALSKAQQVVAKSKRTALSIHVYAICLASKRPLLPVEIERKVLTAGYKTRSKALQKYLLRVLKQDARLYCTNDGRWGIASH